MNENEDVLKELSQLIERVKYQQRLLGVARTQLDAYKKQVSILEEAIYNDRKAIYSIYSLIYEQIDETA